MNKSVSLRIGCAMGGEDRRSYDGDIGALREATESLKDVCKNLADTQIKTIEQMASFQGVCEQVKAQGEILQEHVLKLHDLKDVPDAVEGLVDDQKFVKKAAKIVGLIFSGDMLTRYAPSIKAFFSALPPPGVH